VADRGSGFGKIVRLEQPIEAGNGMLLDQDIKCSQAAIPMPKSVFISYCHNQGGWVWDRLVPCLRGGGADVRIDRERFEVGKAVVGQMDAAQDGATMAMLVLSPDYLNSPYCIHEMERVIRQDPKFARGIIVPVKRVHCELPAKIKRPKPLYVDLQDDSNADQWDQLLRSCKADLRASAPHWLDALHNTRRS
jgi:hypothetical protein